jgi:hypothetical protein
VGEHSHLAGRMVGAAAAAADAAVAGYTVAIAAVAIEVKAR